MQAVILAAGEGIRMRPLTNDTPKPLVKVAGEPLLTYIVRSLPDAIDEIILVIGYRGDQIREFCGEQFEGRKVRYVEQIQKTGTADALWLARPLLRVGKFMALYADDIHAKPSLEKCLSYDYALLIAQHAHPERFGVVEVEDGLVRELIEKPEHPKSNLISAGPIVTDHKISEYEGELHANGERYLTSIINQLAKDVPMHAVESEWSIFVATPEDIAEAEKAFSRSFKK